MAAAIASRVGPIPSARQRSDRPTTSTRAPAAPCTTPRSPGGIRTGSVTMPTTCCTSSEARASSLLASRRPSAGSASVPSRRRLVSSDSREPGGELDRGPVVFGASERGDDGAAGRSCSGGEESDLAGRLLEEVGERLVERAVCEQLCRRLRKYEVDGLLRREQCCLGSCRGGGVRGDTAGHAARRERVSLRRQCSGRGGEVAVVGCEAGEDELSPGAARERLRDREQVAEAVLVPGEDHDGAQRAAAWTAARARGLAAGSPARAPAGPGTARSRARRRTSAASCGRPRAPPPVGRLRRAPASTRRARRSWSGCSWTSASSSGTSWECRPSARSASIRSSSAARRAASRRWISACEDASSARSASGSPRQRSSASRQKAARPGGLRPYRLGDQPLEAEQVELIRVDPDQVSRLLRDDHPAVAEQLAQLRDVELKRVCRGGRRAGRPQHVDQAIDRHSPVGRQEERREQRALLGPAERDRAAAVDDFERSQDPELHRSPRTPL